MRVGIYGGTFDPIHFGHLVLAEQCREQCGLDQVWFVPTSRPPHKPEAGISPARFRCEMIELAIAGHSQFKLNRVEIDRAGVSYTYLTLAQLHDADPSLELFLMIGADSLRDLPTWREPEVILKLATVVAVNRGDRPLEEVRSSAMPDRLAGSKVQFVQMPGMAISASEIRARVEQGKSIRYLVPRAVEAYIYQHGLYQRSRELLPLPNP